MRCIGRTRQLSRCKREAGTRLRFLCNQHLHQVLTGPLAVLAAAGSVVGLRSCRPQDTPAAIEDRAESRSWRNRVDALLRSQTLQARLDSTYELGYAIFDVSKRNRSLTVPRSPGIEANWSSAKLVDDSAASITLLLPDLHGPRNFTVHSTSITIPRVEGYKLGLFAYSGTVLFVECLMDAPDGVIAAIGITAQVPDG